MRRIYLTFFLAFGLISVDQSKAATEIEQRAAIMESTRQAFLAEDFSQLEKLSSAYRTEKSRTSSGIWKLSVFNGGIGRAIRVQNPDVNFEVAFRELEAKTKKWSQQFPNSPSAHIAHSMVLIGHGWAYRGDGYAHTVKPESWAPFRRYVAMARDNLEKHKSIAAIDPRWYETMLTIARAQDWDRGDFDNLLREALDREPLFYQTYFAALEYLLPKWHGGIHEIEVFAQDAVRRTMKHEGRGMYARVYWFASQVQFKNDIFGDSLAVWSRMKSGFEDVVARYPDPWNLNNYAKFACLAQDKPKTMELLKRTESSVVPEAWSPGSLREKCAKWAFQY